MVVSLRRQRRRNEEIKKKDYLENELKSNEVMRDEAISLKKYRDDNKLIEAGLYQEPEDQPSELDGVFITLRSHHQMSHIIM